jgi:hypothetical protein
MTIPFKNGLKRNTSLRRSIDLNSLIIKKEWFQKTQ